jgi:hypothetical protein
MLHLRAISLSKYFTALIREFTFGWRGSQAVGSSR